MNEFLTVSSLTPTKGTYYTVFYDDPDAAFMSIIVTTKAMPGGTEDTFGITLDENGSGSAERLALNDGRFGEILSAPDTADVGVEFVN